MSAKLLIIRPQRAQRSEVFARRAFPFAPFVFEKEGQQSQASAIASLRTLQERQGRTLLTSIQPDMT